MERQPPYDYTPVTERAYDLPDGQSVAVWVIINVEHFRVDEPYREGDPVPNPKDHGRRDYGTRAGYWRLVDVLDEHGVPATLALNAEVCDHQPAVVEAALDRDWAIMGHGTTNSHRLNAMDPDGERDAIETTRDRIEAFAGEPPAGWLSPGLMSTFETPDLLAEAGFEYFCDWCVDDQPFAFDNGLVGVPYTLDLNDKGLFGRQGLTGAQYRDELLAAFRRLREEGRRPGSGRVLPVSVHPFIAGQPSRAPFLGEALATMAGHEDVWLTTGDGIAAHYRESYR